MTDISFCQRVGFGEIVLESAPVNAFDPDLVEAFKTTIAEALAAPVSVVVVSSAIENVFSAGMDLEWAETAPGPTVESTLADLTHAFADLEGADQIVVAAVDGHAHGGGFELALACDVCLVADGEFVFRLPELEFGAIPGAGGTQRLPREIGRSKALDVILSAEAIPPSTAVELGIAQRAFDPAAFDEAVTRYASSIADHSSAALAATKRAVNEGVERDLSAGLALERRLSRELRDRSSVDEDIEDRTVGE